MVFEHAGETLTGELATLITIKDLRRSVPGEGLFQGCHAEIGGQGVGDAPTQHLAGVPVHDHHQVRKAVRHRHVGQVGTPDLVGPVDRQSPQSIRVDRMPRVRSAGVRLAVQGFDSHDPHQPLHPLAVDLHTPVRERVHQPPAAGCRRTDTANAARPADASMSDPPPTPPGVGNTASNVKVPAMHIAAPPAADPPDQSAFGARPGEPSERAC